MSAELPAFMIAGERRCGTSALANALTHHPRICVIPNRDRGYFLDDYARRDLRSGTRKSWEMTHSLQDYAQLFSDHVGANALLGEKSADYLFHPTALQRIRENLPNVKLIVILRHPEARAWSHYVNEVGKGRERYPWEKAIRDESRRMEDPYLRNHLCYLARSRYESSLAELFRVFEPDRVKLVILEEFIQDILRHTNDVISFLNEESLEDLDLAESEKNPNRRLQPRDFVSRNAILWRLAWLNFDLANKLGSRLPLGKQEQRRTANWLKSPCFFVASRSTMTKRERALIEGKFESTVQAVEEILGRPIHAWR